MSTNYGQVYRPLGSEDLHAIKYIVVQVAVDLLLHGVQITLSAAAITILARRHGRSRFTLVAIIGLLLSSTIYAVDNTVFFLVQFPVVIGTSERSIDVLLYRLNILLGVSQDLSAVGGIVELTWIYWPSLYDPYISESISQYLTRFIPLLTTNIVATVLIGKKVLHHRQEIQGLLGFFMWKSQAEAVLMLLLESGLAYILFWLVDFGMFFSANKDGFSGGAIFTNISNHIAGIYPTCVLFAAVGGTTDSLLSAQVSQAMHFADPPAAHEAAREADTTTSSQPEDSNIRIALDGGFQNSRAHRLPGPAGTRSDESRFASSEGIIEVERETTTM
uniref:Uncharacterized protein n=1 Tax=Schizophyllum commune (strain H4-8 / FGSC 9210) TaxID=578458 RepID=D8QA36_SCHCM